MRLLSRAILTACFFFYSLFAFSQLNVTTASVAQDLAQKLVGDGIVISNVSFTGNLQMAGFFTNLGGTNITIDSGIILTSGRAQTGRGFIGVDGDGTTLAQNVLANSVWNLPGDPDLDAAIGFSGEDACVLEFDFMPLGDSIRFNYIFSSEEYTPAYACPGGSGFNDAFAFFISGPGLPGLKNIALVPGTSLPVSIFNVNNVVNAAGIPICPNNPQYFINNKLNVFFTHDGHTTLLTALEQVQPCQIYHLKLVISDVGDAQFDSGVFLQAKSLSSNIIQLNAQTQVDPQNNNYLVEGCNPGSFKIQRPQSDPSPLSVALSYGGDAINGVDVLPLPVTVTIPANQSSVTINVVPIIDNIPEGIERIVVYALAGCASGTPTDSVVIQIRDYDTLGITPRTTAVCKGSPIQLVAAAGYTSYTWNPDPTLNNTNIPNPVATPVAASSTYICTATLNNCNARDSAVITVKDLDFVSKTDINCRGDNTGEIRVAAGDYWIRPVEFSINGGPWQPDSVFQNLPVGSYIISIRDISGCTDNMTINLVQAYPDLNITNTVVTPASCSGAPDGTITINATGGNNPYSFSSDGVNFQSSNVFNLPGGSHTIVIKDANNCTDSRLINIPLNNIVTVDAGPDTTICEASSYVMPAVSNADSYVWTQASTLNNAAILNPTASPVTLTKYFLTATKGICSNIDSVTIDIRTAPVANAGTDAFICYGKTIQLNGSGGLSYQWSPSSYFISSTTVANPDVRPKSTIIYALFVKDQYKCQSLLADSVKITVTPSVKLSAGRDTIVALNQPLQLKAVELGTAVLTQFSWSPSTYLSDPFITDPVALFPVPAASAPWEYVYTVTGTTVDGCEATTGIRIKVYKGPDIYVPTAFSPNGDGKNDILKPINVGIKEFRFFRIFNRWGQLVFSSKDPSLGWNGKVKGVEQATSTFVWVAEGKDYNGNLVSRTGSVTIVR
jgi:gliding motility-associated-like protein